MIGLLTQTSLVSSQMCDEWETLCDMATSYSQCGINEMLCACTQALWGKEQVNAIKRLIMDFFMHIFWSELYK